MLVRNITESGSDNSNYNNEADSLAICLLGYEVAPVQSWYFGHAKNKEFFYKKKHWVSDLNFGLNKHMLNLVV